MPARPTTADAPVLTRRQLNRAILERQWLLDAEGGDGRGGDRAPGRPPEPGAVRHVHGPLVAARGVPSRGAEQPDRDEAGRARAVDAADDDPSPHDPRLAPASAGRPGGPGAGLPRQPVLSEPRRARPRRGRRGGAATAGRAAPKRERPGQGACGALAGSRRDLTLVCGPLAAAGRPAAAARALGTERPADPGDGRALGGRVGGDRRHARRDDPALPRRVRPGERDGRPGLVLADEARARRRAAPAAAPDVPRRERPRAVRRPGRPAAGSRTRPPRSASSRPTTTSSCPTRTAAG